MEKIDKMKDGPRALMDNIAVNMVSFYERKRKYAARLEWNRLVGAAKMYVMLADEYANPIQEYALRILEKVCEIYGEDYFDVIDFIASKWKKGERQ